MLFHRQRVLLEFLRQAGRPVSKIELMKWAFLLKEESRSKGGSSFYEFVPYHYGPYSFGLSRDAAALDKSGLLAAEAHEWKSNPATPNQLLPHGLAQDVSDVVGHFGSLSQDDLIRYVYSEHAAYTVNSRLERLETRKVAEPGVYTVGYEGRQLDGLLDVLIHAGIRRLIDVRRNPVSRRFGFHKSTLAKHCTLLDIDYIHVPELGIASEERSTLSATRDYADLFARYEQQTLLTQAAHVQRVAEWMRTMPSAIMCMERDVCDCHRGRLAYRLHDLTRLPVIHLR
jgi:uncharacterized protein (DUF488 family)